MSEKLLELIGDDKELTADLAALLSEAETKGAEGVEAVNADALADAKAAGQKEGIVKIVKEDDEPKPPKECFKRYPKDPGRKCRACPWATECKKLTKGKR